MHLDVSFIVTVFNKAQSLPFMLTSILRQVDELACEFIFVDDASTDNSIETIEEIFNQQQNYLIITNNINIGPAIRLNQGCLAASGKYLFLIDADDILIENALVTMFNVIRAEQADFVFGRHRVTNYSHRSLLDIALKKDYQYQASNTPINTVLSGKYVRMAYMMTKALYIEANGADARVFIQDESLPLRLAYHATKMVTFKEPLVYAASSANSLSKNKLQQLHDKFYVYYYALKDFKHLTELHKAKIYKRAISCVWKAKKIQTNFLDKFIFFFVYLATKLSFFNTNCSNLEKYKSFIDSLPNVRKV